MTCEKCWSDAFMMSYGTLQDQSDCYRQLIENRRDKPCSPKEQAGQWWDEDRQIDVRLLDEKS